MPTETAANTPALTIAKFDKALHDCSDFSCGFRPIDNFLKSSLSDQIKTGMVAAWIAAADGDPAVLGFYTLVAMAVRVDLGPRKLRCTGVPDLPVIYIRLVAVHMDMQGKGLGTALMVDAMRRCLGITDQMGAMAIVLDALRDNHLERRWNFYRKLGFHPPGDPLNPERVYPDDQRARNARLRSQQEDLNKIKASCPTNSPQLARVCCQTPAPTTVKVESLGWIHHSVPAGRSEQLLAFHLAPLQLQFADTGGTAQAWRQYQTGRCPQPRLTAEIPAQKNLSWPCNQQERSLSNCARGNHTLI